MNPVVCEDCLESKSETKTEPWFVRVSDNTHQCTSCWLDDNDKTELTIDLDITFIVEAYQGRVRGEFKFPDVVDSVVVSDWVGVTLESMFSINCDCVSIKSTNHTGVAENTLFEDESLICYLPYEIFMSSDDVVVSLSEKVKNIPNLSIVLNNTIQPETTEKINAAGMDGTELGPSCAKCDENRTDCVFIQAYENDRCKYYCEDCIDGNIVIKITDLRLENIFASKNPRVEDYEFMNYYDLSGFLLVYNIKYEALVPDMDCNCVEVSTSNMRKAQVLPWFEGTITYDGNESDTGIHTPLFTPLRRATKIVVEKEVEGPIYVEIDEDFTIFNLELAAPSTSSIEYVFECDTSSKHSPLTLFL